MSSNKVFVSFYATLGDADGSIDGSKIMDKDEWEWQVPGGIVTEWKL